MNITVVVREQGSGTREAFDKVVTDGTHFLEEKDSAGKKVYNTASTAVQQTKTGTVLSAVAADKNAIGYISLGSVNDTIRVLKVNGVAPSEDTVLSGRIQRPFVVMTHKGQTLTPVTADFMSYLKSAAAKNAADAAGCIYLSDPAKRANAGAEAIPVVSFEKQASLPEGGKIVVTAPAESSTGRVIVLLSDGESKTIMKTLTFVSGVMNVTTQSQEAAATPAGHSASASMAERVAASTPAATTSPTSETASSQEPPVERHQAPNEDVARTNADILRDRLPKS